MNRRELLIALSACAGCAWFRKPLEPVLPPGPVTLGWRWVPGERLTYRCVTRREASVRVSWRAEEWGWLVRDVDAAGVAHLEGRLSGFGAGMSEGGVPLSDDALVTALAVERVRADQVVELQIGLDGRLAYIEPLAFADALPHRLLALRVPATPVAPHDEWPLPGFVRPFESLLPEGVEAESRATGRLVDVTAEEDRVVAMLETTGTVRTAAGPTLHVSGTATWDTGRGGLVRRDVLARFTPSAPDPEANPGTLAVTLWRVNG